MKAFEWSEGYSDRLGTRVVMEFVNSHPPSIFGQAFSAFLLRQFFLTLPNDLSEATRLGGCSEC